MILWNKIIGPKSYTNIKKQDLIEITELLIKIVSNKPPYEICTCFISYSYLTTPLTAKAIKLR